MHTSVENRFEQWLARVGALLEQNYCVTLNDVGWAPDELKKFWEQGDEAGEFVEWFALKYDLEPYSQYVDDRPASATQH